MLIIFIIILIYITYANIWQIATEAIIPTISPINADINTNRIFFIPTAAVYIAIVYIVVSVDPIIVDIIFPSKLSTP